MKYFQYVFYGINTIVINEKLFLLEYVIIDDLD